MKQQSIEFEGIGTHWSIELTLPQDVILENIAESIQSIVESFDSVYSRFREDSVISAIAKKKWVIYADR